MEHNEEKKSKRGGARPNSGRPRNDRNYTLNVKISKEANDRLLSVGNKSEFIDKLIKETL